jgi:hypothetical protein
VDRTLGLKFLFYLIVAQNRAETFHGAVICLIGMFSKGISKPRFVFSALNRHA